MSEPVPGARTPAAPGQGARASVVTPEAVPLALETATIGSRGIAYVLDLLIWGSGLVLLTLAQAALGWAGFVPGSVGIALLLLAAFGLQFGYPIGFETLWRGRTPGKAVMGLRVVTVEGAAVGVRHATLRATVGLFELLGTLGAVAVVSSFASGRGQRLGDLAAGTIVVREPRVAEATTTTRFLSPPGLEEYVARLDVSALSAGEYATVRDTLLRLPSLAPSARTRVAAQVATPLLARVTPPPPGGLTPELWLSCVAAAVQGAGARAGAVGSAPAPPSSSATMRPWVESGRTDPAGDPPAAGGAAAEGRGDEPGPDTDPEQPRRGFVPPR